MISVAALAKTFEAEHGRVAAVRGVDFEVGEGEVFVLLGPSGCGKSTTLRCIAGLEKPDAGTIGIAGTTMSSAGSGVFVPPEARRVAMVFQSHAVWPHMTVLENVTFPLVDGVHRVAKHEALQRARKALQMVQLDGLDQRPATQLSGGQQQRVALARALALEPRVLLMDEPLSNLDAALRERMREEMKGLFAQLGLTVVYVTHDQVEALSLASRVAVMSEGHLLQVGPPEEVYERPASLAVLNFFGQTNLLPAEVAAPGELKTPIGAIKVAAEGAPGDQVTLAIRPEDVELCDGGGADAVQATVRKRTFLGDHVLLEVAVEGVGLKVKAPRRAPAAGQTVWLRFPADRWRVFPVKYDPGDMSPEALP